MEHVILTVKASITKLWLSIFYLFVAIVFFGISTYLFATPADEEVELLFAFFGIIALIPGIGWLVYYFLTEIVFYEDGRIVCRDMLRGKRTVHKANVKRIRVSTDSSFRKWISLYGKKGKELVRIPGHMQGYEEVYPLVREYHVPIEYWKYSRLGISKRTWENKA